VRILEGLIGELKIRATDVLAVGDGANDIPMLLAAGLGVALHAKPKVREQARIAIDHGDLTALLYLQGYTKAQFIGV
jgi:phosphoserine phosphatase